LCDIQSDESKRAFKEALRNWIKNLVDKNELYARAAADVNVDEEAGAIDVEDDAIEDIVDLVPVEEEMAIVSVINTTMAEVQERAKQNTARTNAKPQSSETEDEYAASALRTLCSREMKIDKSEAKENNLQNLYGGLEPVLETRYNEEEMGWAGDWIGRLWQWMSANDIFIHGGTRLDLACIGDRSLTDIVQGKYNRCIRVGAMCYDLTNLAQIILPDGLTFRQEVQEYGIWNSHEHSQEWEGRNWPSYIRQILGSGTQKKLTLEHALRGKRSGNVWFQLGKEVGFRMTNQSDMKIGRIAGQCKGWIAVDVWIPQAAATKSTRHKNGLPSWKKPEAAERVTIQDTQAFPVSTTLLSKEPHELYSVDGKKKSRGI
jgi:hypothetical protein